MRKALFILITVIQILFFIWLFVFDYLLKHSMTTVRYINFVNHSWEQSFSPTLWMCCGIVIFAAILIYCLIRNHQKGISKGSIVGMIMSLGGIAFIIFARGYSAYYYDSITILIIVVLQLINLLVPQATKLTGNSQPSN